MLQIGNGHYVIEIASTGSVAPSSVLLMAKVVQCVHAHGVCALQSSSCLLKGISWGGQ